MADPESPRRLWRHPHPESTNTHAFKTSIEQRYHLRLDDYEALRRWSVDNLSAFWEEVAIFTKIRFSEPFEKVTLALMVCA